MSKVISIRLPDEERQDIEKIAQEQGMTVSDAVRICLEGISQGHFEIRDKAFTVTEDYLNALRPVSASDDSEYIELGFGSVLRLLRKKKYPDKAIRRLTEQMKETIMDNGDYNPRRVRDDIGC